MGLWPGPRWLRAQGVGQSGGGTAWDLCGWKGRNTHVLAGAEGSWRGGWRVPGGRLWSGAGEGGRRVGGGFPRAASKRLAGVVGGLRRLG